MEHIHFQISPVLNEINPKMVFGILQCNVANSDHNPELWKEIQQVSVRVRESLSFEGIKDQPQVAATRKMYAACGKDPSRYRPSAEALMRRIVKGQDLYQINTLVDLINLVSLKSGYSIGGFDVSFIEGAIEAGLGKPDEIYHAIGRGLLNIENLPVLRDRNGPIGTPTSDEERTAIRLETNQLLMVFYAYDGHYKLAEHMDYAVDLLKRYAAANIIHSELKAFPDS